MQCLYLFILAFFSLTFYHASSQPPPNELLFSHEIETLRAAGQLSNTSASSYYTFIGDYHAAIANYDIEVCWGLDTAELDHLYVADALDKIVEIAREKQIVIISESHLKPQHRIFAKKIIVSLAEHGFSHLGLETLGVNQKNINNLRDSILNSRGYPLFNETGYYSREPQMAGLIRGALKSNYTLFAYERIGNIPGKDRDEIQADNVIRYIEESSAEKIILLCGWHHAIESDTIKRGTAHWMARYLKEKISIDPLTIYQDNFTEKVFQTQHPYLEEHDISLPSLFLEKDGSPARLTEYVDLEIIHPRTRYWNGRPSWLFQDLSYREHHINPEAVEIDYPILIRAFFVEEEGDVVAADVIEVKSRYEMKPLILLPGVYRIVISNKSEEHQMYLILDP